MKVKCLVDKAWIAAALVSMIFHITDMPYYDGKVSIILWILLAGVKCIGDEQEIVSRSI